MKIDDKDDDLEVRYIVYDTEEIEELKKRLEDLPITIDSLFEGDIHEIGVRLDETNEYSLVIYLDLIGNQRALPEVVAMYENKAAAKEWAKIYSASADYKGSNGSSIELWEDEVNRRLILERMVKPDKGVKFVHCVDNQWMDSENPDSEDMIIYSEEGSDIVEIQYFGGEEETFVRISMIGKEL